MSLFNRNDKSGEAAVTPQPQASPPKPMTSTPTPTQTPAAVQSAARR